ncbi:WD40-repeat-containing domain protein [Lentinula aff. lateritia]|uniref:WD40-repeat-containing domain protein n=1 Tax=Lentinula aff. lateritia TaxID=2804960 RepID=A0ACC1TX68_9AGAR|nr:WD40-repeat-containing domain protein [Lentinula aff. lateritia]
MPDSFFTSGKPRKRKRVETSPAGAISGKKIRHTPNPKGKKPKSKRLDEDLDSDQTSGLGDDDDLRAPLELEDEVEGDEDPDETPAEKRLRLAHLYLDGVKEDLAANQGDFDFDAAEIDKELISSRLRGAQYKGRVHLFVADEFAEASSSHLKVKGHRFSCTAAVASPVISSSTTPGYYLFTAGKEGHIMKWDLQNGKQVAVMYKVKPDKGKGKGKGRAVATRTAGHTSSVTSLALTTDGTYLASGCMDSRACVWDARSCRWIASFTHKDTISSLLFRTNTNSATASSSAHTLYTASFDRTVKLWTLPTAAPLSSLTFDSTSKGLQTPSQNMGYIETLFGHQDQILALDCLPSLPTLPPISSTSVIRRPPSTFTVIDPSPVPASATAKTLTYARHPLTTPAETLLTVGARDKTARFWKVPEETQLVFRGGGATSTSVQGHEIRTKRDKLRDVLEGKMDALAADDENSGDEDAKRGQKKGVQENHRYIEGSLESVAMIDENSFLTGGDSGSICLWSTSKKKPVFTCSVAHGAFNPLSEQVDEEETEIPPHPRWITALASLRYSDLFASGSYDGNIRLWKLISSSSKSVGQLSSFTLLCTIPCAGVINSLQFITPEEGFWAGANWAFSDACTVNSVSPQGKSVDNDSGPRKQNPDARPILLIASVGQEHRFGRWEVPVHNGAIVWSLFPKGWGER